ncbi:MAG TPA: hypothetical protein QGG27_03195 [Acidimicrobiales bacterium]|jgi:spermidine synthase|nr:hypothetical protein [Acidimicrobiales bacterium]HJL91278.1 hypothetical protein [Acidimicrobiales bacterium]|tara:strand:+ start:132 stop:2543 length:2412 start_codon:yes stop_codon:yes gene_type:complete
MKIRLRSLLEKRDYFTIFALGMCGLLIEISYTRIVSYKLFYYYTYLVIGLALLGLGCGGVLLTISSRLRQLSKNIILEKSGFLAAITLICGYFIVAKIPINTTKIWDYGTLDSFRNVCSLVILCLSLFIPFVAIGLAISSLLSSRPERINRLYATDLVGAALACIIAIPLQISLGPPLTIILTAMILSLISFFYQSSEVLTKISKISILVITLLAVTIPNFIPEIKTENIKSTAEIEFEHSEWGPVFRIDVQKELFDRHLIYHDALLGSNIIKFDGNFSKLSHLENDPRSIPFRTFEPSPENALIIGSAGGHEILSSLFFQTKSIEAVELNPVTTSLLKEKYYSYSGGLINQPGVKLTTGDGRTHLTRSNKIYDLIWFVAPDSYAANNSASSGAFVLSESYLYTVEMLDEAFEHLTEEGVIVAQFGEYDFDQRPNRTARYVSTAYESLTGLNVENPSEHIVVATSLDYPASLSTILIKKKPFSAVELKRLSKHVESIEGTKIRYMPNQKGLNKTIELVASSPYGQLKDALDNYPYNLSPVHDNAPFFWHFQNFSDVLNEILEPVDPARDPEVAVGERVLILLLIISVLLAATFLLLPFYLIRKDWSELPNKKASFSYFAALGIGFMLLEITMIQKLVLLLGYPTYSLAVTLASLLIFTGIGSASSSFISNKPKLRLWLLIILSTTTASYLIGLTPLTNLLIQFPLWFRFFSAFIILAPLGLCLGVFMPLGLGSIARISNSPTIYISWAWAINGFFSVIGSVLTTILAMTYGFGFTQSLGLTFYLIAILIFPHLSKPVTRQELL